MRSRFASLRKPQAGVAPAPPPPSQEQHSHDDVTKSAAAASAFRLIEELWAFYENRIAVRFAYEWRDDSGHWFRSYGTENWEFDGNGLMARRIASINDLPIHEADRQYRWPLGRRPEDHPGLSDLGLLRRRPGARR